MKRPRFKQWLRVLNYEALLDENLPHQLRHEIIGHDCFTVAFMGWSGVRNGKLLHLAQTDGFDALVSKDANIQYEQNLVNLPTTVIVLHASSNDIDDIRPLLPALHDVLTNLPAKSLVHVSG